MTRLKRQMWLEVCLAAIGVVVSVAFLIAECSPGMSTMAGILSYLAANLLVLRFEVSRLSETNSAVYELERILRAYRSAYRMLGQSHVFIRWLTPLRARLEDKASEVAQGMFSVSTEEISLPDLYVHAYRRDKMFRACEQIDGLRYMLSHAGNVHLRTIWQQQQAGTVTTVQRLFIVEDDCVDRRLEAMLRFHVALDWEMYVIGRSQVDAVKTQLSGGSGLMLTERFAIHGGSIVCEAFDANVPRARVRFIAKQEVVDAYLDFFSTACELGKRLSPLADQKRLEFSAAYRNLVDECSANKSVDHYGSPGAEAR